MNNKKNKEPPYFVDFGIENSILINGKKKQFVDKNLPWYYCDDTNRTPTEIIKIEKSIIKELEDEAKKIKKGLVDNPKKMNTGITKSSITYIKNDLWNKKYNATKWQREARKTKYVNNLEYLFNEVFCELANKANLGDKSDKELSAIFQKSAEEVSTRMESIIERNAFKAQLIFPLPTKWSDGKALLSKWLIESIPEFESLQVKTKNKVNLKDQLKQAYGLNEINKNMNRISEFAKEIYERRILKKSNGKFYALKSIKRELYNLLGKEEKYFNTEPPHFN